MCTLYWKREGALVRLLFNRDELKSRPISEDLAWHENSSGKRTVYAKDPLGGGTWLGYNPEARMVVGLLNANLLPESRGSDLIKRRSRGLLVTDVLSMEDEDAVSEWLTVGGRLGVYNPFHMFCVGLRKSFQIHWDGEQFWHREPAVSFYSSSSFDSQNVREERERKIQELVKDGESIEVFRELFLRPTGEADGICMDRDDAQTFSFSEITWSETGFSYELMRREGAELGFAKAMRICG